MLECKIHPFGKFGDYFKKGLSGCYWCRDEQKEFSEECRQEKESQPVQRPKRRKEVR